MWKKFSIANNYLIDKLFSLAENIHVFYQILLGCSITFITNSVETEFENFDKTEFFTFVKKEVSI